jgi:hypothetical protein
MVNPSFGGVALFGNVDAMPTSDNPRDRQINAYNGLNGLEVLDGGGRGRVTNVSGRLYGAGLSGLAAAISLFRSFHDGGAYVLVDTAGNSWPVVRLERFEPAGRIRQDANETCWQDYTAEFLHVI